MAEYPHPVWLYRFERSRRKWVFVPNDDTKQYGRDLKENILKLWVPPRNYVHLGSQGHVRALRTHTSSKYFARIDIKGFYNSITKSRVTRRLKELFRSYDIARAAAVMSTVPNPVAETDKDPKYVLPFGFVQSPIIAALCLFKSKLGSAIRSLPHHVKRCVYVDDIVISTERSAGDLMLAFDVLCAAANESGFQLNDDKLLPPSEFIQAFNIDIANQHLEVSATRLEQFRAALGIANSQHVVDGILGYVGSVNVDQANSLQSADYDE